MSKRLAIRGHSTRGNEVIEILEMMGGNNIYNFSGFDGYAYYVIGGYQNEIRAGEYIFGDEDMCFFTLEEFLEKYPFKIGDVIRFPNDIVDIVEEIAEMEWDEDSEDILCTSVSGWKRFLRAHLENPKNNKQKETMLVDNLSSKWVNEFECPDGYQFKDENGNVINTTKIVLEKKKKEYPKTYKECFNVCFGNKHHIIQVVGFDGDNKELFESFIKLKICRDAYWKIYGEQIGLGKPWEPNWTTFEGMPAIFRFRYNIVCDFVCDSIKSQHCLLVFPTVEMRNSFYENFKDLIEQCKELL